MSEAIIATISEATINSPAFEPAQILEVSGRKSPQVSPSAFIGPAR